MEMQCNGDVIRSILVDSEKEQKQTGEREEKKKRKKKTPQDMSSVLFLLGSSIVQ